MLVIKFTKSLNKYAKFEVVSAFKLETFKYCKFSNLLKILSESMVLEISKFVKSIEVNLLYTLELIPL